MTIDVINIKKIGKIFINNKNKNFLSLKLILNFIFFTKSQIKKKKVEPTDRTDDHATHGHQFDHQSITAHPQC